ncbi:hypothetical protein BDZ45DRAFT_269677 [Acephala macrosclerotiorum]|nr:hypothetical protein BDZ45DRAFT_269677 [Acephala macrosclerotiorum]
MMKTACRANKKCQPSPGGCFMNAEDQILILAGLPSHLTHASHFANSRFQTIVLELRSQKSMRHKRSLTAARLNHAVVMTTLGYPSAIAHVPTPPPSCPITTGRDSFKSRPFFYRSEHPVTFHEPGRPIRCLMTNMGSPGIRETRMAWAVEGLKKQASRRTLEGR